MSFGSLKPIVKSMTMFEDIRGIEEYVSPEARVYMEEEIDRKIVE